ncbi:FAD binding domain-containing protein [Paenibacillus abyssi]|uniref:Xanthine dehydrogenase subunit C n=1 Tax=Paenibacillus abyssi TaxID=1340531 RepID=A0A917CW82_9BACL|nr:FAD binding domain-containing protein [Paenibacillus abyssi]GGF99791.1 putative xanthine dehydrogenase subunit C [Paenibacillus abyssi]
MMEQENRTSFPKVWQPADLSEAWRLKHMLGDAAVYTAGTTYLRTQWEAEGAAPPGHFIDLCSTGLLAGIELKDGELLTIGALTTLASCRSSALLVNHVPVLMEAVRAIAAPSVRNLATIGGNVASTFGDALPALLVYEAQLVWYDGKLLQVEPLADWLAGLRHAAANHAAKDNRILKEIRIPIASDSDVDSGMRLEMYKKIGRREAFTPSLVSVAMTGRIHQDGLLSGFRIALGGGGAIAQRLKEVESLLQHANYTQPLLGTIYDMIVENAELQGDLFASALYKKQTAANLILSALWRAAGQAGMH